ncbi:transglutaminase family protein [Amycolatopsis sp. H20-H5]|uniref:transglutaminase family protein n=1 Tax=Amycolatopsis sp. H20-H5 TaxID=3046309 RepID=UPI002DB81EED|nr:DUF3488 and transglutaminase-like domain-containing protein [Amycolatopsis sp. H20-H5]MEC3977653.1 DUF3488 and transglutaminase-like domain-containing protein [Amycolatopsis sp. H20-H5]
MTATAPPRLHTPTPREPPRPSVWSGTVLAPVAAGVATLCAATSLTGVVAGWAWFGYLLVAVVLVASTGLALRSLRAPTVVVGLCQLLVLLFLITGAFSTSGFLQIIPGPAAFGELRDVLAASAEQIRTGLPPVEGTPPILCLVTIAIGLVAVLVDTLAVAAAAPAATGLVLLCVYAVPAALSDEMLPWWTFLLGAGAFAGLLAIDGSHRHRNWRNRDAPGLGGSPGTMSMPVAAVSAAIVLGLIAGVAITGVGTVGSLPGNTGQGRGGSGGFGVEPFTELRGLLDQGADVELFKVRGMGPDKRLLRAFTLDTYTPNKGWGLAANGRAQTGVQANRPLPPAPGDDGTGTSRAIQIEPTNWNDNWLPIYGAPRALTGVGDNWLYDRVSGAVFTTSKQSPPPYVESASVREPTKDELRAADPKAELLPAGYTRIDRVDSRVQAKAEQLTEGKSNNFDKAQALWQFFTAQNGFVYDTKTAPPTDSDALADFILKGKRGFCEQYASAMAVMLRAVGIPSRVAIGFTSGTPRADYQAISSQDAHAWVEVYFGDKGWVSFDPTPLTDGRGIVPSYLRPDSPDGPGTKPDTEKPNAPTSSAPPTGTAPDKGKDLAAGQADQQAQADPVWPAIVAAVLAALAALVVAAGYVYNARRRRPGPAGPESSGARKKNGRESPERVDDTGQNTLLPTLINWAPLIGAGLFTAAIAFLAAWVSWWFALIVLLLLGGLSAPATLREIARRRRLQTISGHSPAAADAAWHELLDECADRGLPIPVSDTVRVAGMKVAQKHHLDEDGRAGLRTVIGVVEKAWYAKGGTEDPSLEPAFDDVRQSLRRNAPMSWRGRLFPKSVLRRNR